MIPDALGDEPRFDSDLVLLVEGVELEGDFAGPPALVAATEEEAELDEEELEEWIEEAFEEWLGDADGVGAAPEQELDELGGVAGSLGDVTAYHPGPAAAATYHPGPAAAARTTGYLDHDARLGRPAPKPYDPSHILTKAKGGQNMVRNGSGYVHEEERRQTAARMAKALAQAQQAGVATTAGDGATPSGEEGESTPLDSTYIGVFAAGRGAIDLGAVQVACADAYKASNISAMASTKQQAFENQTASAREHLRVMTLEVSRVCRREHIIKHDERLVLTDGKSLTFVGDMLNAPPLPEIAPRLGGDARTQGFWIGRATSRMLTAIHIDMLQRQHEDPNKSYRYVMCEMGSVTFEISEPIPGTRKFQWIKVVLNAGHFLLFCGPAGADLVHVLTASDDARFVWSAVDVAVAKWPANEETVLTPSPERLAAALVTLNEWKTATSWYQSGAKSAKRGVLQEWPALSLGRPFWPDESLANQRPGHNAS